MISKKSGISNAVCRTACCLVMGVIAAVFVSGAVAVFLGAPAHAKAEFSAQTKLPCGQCHANPAGGGKLKTFGEKFKANGNKL